MNKAILKKLTRCFFSILTLAYSLVSSVFLMVLVVTKISNYEFLVPIVFKVILLYCLFGCFLLSVVYYVIAFTKNEYYKTKLLLILCVNDLLLLLVWLWDPFSLLSFFLG
ncbi:MAG: hypothetical protein CW341_10520 [Bacteroidetes bacterium]|nr:hypothetical protein [Bacteroidota bacterium]